MNVGDALLNLVPQRIPGLPAPGLIPDGQRSAGTFSDVDRSSVVIVRALPDLLRVDPTYICGDTLRVAAWVLKADGKLIPQTSSNCNEPGPNSSFRTEVSISYTYPAADGAQAIAVFTKINHDLYIDRLAGATVTQGGLPQLIRGAPPQR